MQTPQGSEFGIATKDSGEYEMQHPDGDSEGEAEECARRDAVWVAQKARWRIEHVHSRHFMATINFSKKLFCKPLTITTSNGTTYRSAQTLDRDELFHRFQYECLVQGVKIYNDNKLRYPGTFDRVTEVFDTPGSERLLEWQQDVAQDYHRVIDQNGNTVAPWDTFPYLCRFSPPALMPTREHVLHPMDRPYPVQNGEQPIHHPGAPAPFVEDNGNGPRQMHYKWRFGMPEMEALLENYSPVPRLCTGPGNTLRWNPEQIGCMQSSLITNSARRFDPPNYADTLPHYGKAFSMIMVRGLAAARSRVEIKARVRRRQIAEELAAVDPLDLNAVNRITQPGPYSYSILRPEYQRADGTMVFDRRNPQELAPGGPADMIYRQYRIMKQQFVAIQTAQGETGPFSLPMPLNMRNAITLALAPMQPRAAEFVRIREAIAGQADRAREHFAQWQRWNPGRPVNEYLTPQYLTNPIPPPQVFATLNDYIYQGGVYTAFVPDISTYGSELLTAFQSYGSQPLSRPKRKADMLSPTVPEAPAKIFRKAIGLSGNSIELAPNGIGPATQQTGMVLGNTGNNALISVPTPQTALAAYNPSSTASNPVPFNYQDLFARDEPQTPPTFVPERASLVPEDNFTPLPPFNFDPNDHLYNSQVSTPVTVNRALPPTDIMDLRPEVQGLLGGEVGAMQVWIPTTVNGVLPVAGGNAHLGGEEGTMEGETFDFPELPAIVPGGFDYSQFLHEDLFDDSFVFSQSSFD